MADRPILFSAPMILALLAGRKTQTRRILKPQPTDEAVASGCYAERINKLVAPSPIRFAVGDRLWCRETWCPDPNDIEDDGTISVSYRADGHHAFGLKPSAGWKLPLAAQRGGVPGIHMPRWASRLTLTVTDVRVERLHEISEEDALAEGIVQRGKAYGLPDWPGSKCLTFAGWAYLLLWADINGPTPEEKKNPWVAAYTFTVERRNVDRGL